MNRLMQIATTIAIVILASTAAGASQYILLTWEPVAGASHYELVIAEDAQLAQIALSTTVATPAYRWKHSGRLYFWRVRGVDAQGRAGAWSEVRSTEAPAIKPEPKAPLKAPRLSQPPDNYVGMYDADPHELTLSFERVESTSTIVEVAADRKFAKNVIRTRSDSGRALVTIPGPGKFYWRAVAVAADGRRSVPTPRRTFTIRLGAPRPVEPAPGAAVSPGAAGVTLRWSTVRPAVRWQVEVTQHEGITRDVTSASLSLATLKPGATTWRVRAFDARSEAGPWSELRTFTLLPSTVVLRQPEPDQVLRLPTPEGIQLVWDPVESAAEYEIELATTEDFATVAQRATTVAPSLMLENTPPADYWWRVTARFPESDVRITSVARRFSLVAPAPPPAPTIRRRPPPPVSAAATDAVAWGVGARVGIQADLINLFAPYVGIDFTLVPGWLDGCLLLTVRIAYRQNQSEYVAAELGSYRVEQTARAIPITLAAAYRWQLDFIDLTGGVGPSMEAAHLAVGASQAWAARLGAEAFVEAGFALGPGTLRAEVSLTLFGLDNGLLQQAPASLALAVGYRYGL